MGYNIVKVAQSHAPGILKLYDIVYGGGYSRSSLTSLTSIESLLMAPEICLYIGVMPDGNVVGSGGGICDKWNRVVEIGMMAVHPDYRTSDICFNIHNRCLQSVEPQYDMLVYVMRSQASDGFAQHKVLSKGGALCGYLPGRHKVGGVRENHQR